MTLSEIRRIWLDDEAIHIETNDGRVGTEKFCDYRRLCNASEQQRINYKTNDFGIYWPDIDEDLSFDGFLKKNEMRTGRVLKAECYALRAVPLWEKALKEIKKNELAFVDRTLEG